MTEQETRDEAALLLEITVSNRLRYIVEARQAVDGSHAAHDLAVEAYLIVWRVFSARIGAHPYWKNTSKAREHYETCLLEAAALLREGFDPTRRLTAFEYEKSVAFENTLVAEAKLSAQYELLEQMRLKPEPNRSKKRLRALGRLPKI